MINDKRTFRAAFTLAEMMVVLLILSIILAAFAPIMTKRTASSVEGYWKSKNNGGTIFFGLNQNQTVNIGQEPVAGENARLILNVGANDQNHILFKRGNTALEGFLRMDANDNLRFSGERRITPLSMASNTKNTSIGIGSLRNLTTGRGNTAVGTNALASTNANYNTAVGANSLYSNTTGDGNTAIGINSMYLNTEGIYNTAVGRYALYNNLTGNDNVAVGQTPLYSNTEGYGNTAVSNSALAYNTTGNYNTAVGLHSMFENKTGSYNTAIGYQACYFITGSNNTCIGGQSGPASVSGAVNNTVWIGTNKSTVYIEGDLLVGGNVTDLDGKRIKWGTGSKDQYTTFADVGDLLSDIRLKNVKGENKSGLEKIKQLKVFNYTFKDDKDKTPRVGVIAQELKKVFPDAVSKDDKGYLRVRTEDILYAIVNAVKELDAKINEILKQVQGDKDKIKALEAKNKELEERIKKLEARF